MGNYLEPFHADDETGGLDPLVCMAVLHHEIESIQPFCDGNGRTGRILKLPDFFQSEAELRALGRAPDTRAKWLQGLAEKDFGHDKRVAMQLLIDAEHSDRFDVLADVAYALPIVTRVVRADQARVHINSKFNAKQQAFLDFVLQHYVTEGVEELEQNKLNPLLRLKYHDSIADAVADLGGKPEEIGRVFAGFQRYLHTENAR